MLRRSIRCEEAQASEYGAWFNVQKRASAFFNDVCLRQMMLAMPMMTALPNDVCLTAHDGKHRIIATRSGATSF